MKYSLLVPTSMGVRLTPATGQTVYSGNTFTLQATSAETNAASIPSYLGMPVKVLTAFVEGHPFARFIKENLRSRGMDAEGPDVPQGGPWGYRHQINLADSGSGLRGPRVWNDRAGEVGRTLCAKDFDLGRIFGEEGVRMMHLSGLITALAPQFCLDLVDCARAHGTRISFDLNYRASFWKGNEEALLEAFLKIASSADILIGNEEDFQLCLGVKGPETGGEGLESKIEAFKAMISLVRRQYPGVKILATTLREVKDASTHLWGAIVSEGDDTIVIPPREIHVLDRIGGGDGFTGGLLYGILQGWSVERSAQFAWASGVLATTFPTDYAHPSDERQVWSIWNGNARVIR